MRKPRYTTLVDYMERTHTSGVRLRERVNEKLALACRPPLSEQYFSMILRGSRRCSRENAWVLHVITEVPMDELTRWPRYAETETTESVA